MAHRLRTIAQKPWATGWSNGSVDKSTLADLSEDPVQYPAPTPWHTLLRGSLGFSRAVQVLHAHGARIYMPAKTCTYRAYKPKKWLLRSWTKKKLFCVYKLNVTICYRDRKLTDIAHWAPTKSSVEALETFWTQGPRAHSWLHTLKGTGRRKHPWGGRGHFCSLGWWHVRSLGRVCMQSGCVCAQGHYDRCWSHEQQTCVSKGCICGGRRAERG